MLLLEISPGKHEYSVQEATAYETTGPSTRKARTAHLQTLQQKGLLGMVASIFKEETLKIR